MEISDYLKVARRRLWVLILVPLLATLVVGVAILRQPPQYASTATVAAPAVVGGASTNQYSGATGAKAFVANFTAAITSPVILNRVSAETHVRTGLIVSGLSTVPIGTSSLMHVTYTTDRLKTATSVAQTAATETIRFLFRTQVTLAQREETEARKSVDSVQADLNKFYLSTHLLVPEKDYEIKAQQIANLQQQQLQDLATGNPSGAAALGAAVRQRQTELAKTAAQVVAYNALVDRKTQAQNELDTAHGHLAQALAQYDAADPSATVNVSSAHAVSRAADLLQLEAPAIGAGVFLAIGLVVLFEVVSRRSRVQFRGETRPRAERQSLAATP